jgi:hypothetical protein
MRPRGRRDQAVVELVRRGHGPVAVGLQQLQLGQARTQHGQAEPGEAAQDERTALEGALPLVDVAELEGGFVHL